MPTIVTTVLVTWALLALVLGAAWLLGRSELGRSFALYPVGMLLLVPVSGLVGVALFQVLFLVDPAFRASQAEYARLREWSRACETERPVRDCREQAWDRQQQIFASHFPGRR